LSVKPEAINGACEFALNVSRLILEDVIKGHPEGELTAAGAIKEKP
jgi:hypothetical protein